MLPPLTDPHTSAPTAGGTGSRGVCVNVPTLPMRSSSNNAHGLPGVTAPVTVTGKQADAPGRW
jgi:hypothetical protein